MELTGLGCILLKVSGLAITLMVVAVVANAGYGSSTDAQMASQKIPASDKKKKIQVSVLTSIKKVMI